MTLEQLSLTTTTISGVVYSLCDYVNYISDNYREAK